MKPIILLSRIDPTYGNYVSAIKELECKIPFYVLEKDSIDSENIDKIPELKEYDFFIFSTEHRSEKGTPSLSCHAIGNWNKADFGGKPKEVCLTSGVFLKTLFKTLNENSINSNYQITLECTHHGPYLEKPCCFIEIGSGEQEWKDKSAGKIIIKTIQDSLEKYEKEKKDYKTAIGIGGPHYCPNFNKIQLNSYYALSHIIPEYCLPATKKMINQAIEKTTEKVDLIIIDWKGLGKSKQKNNLLEILKTTNLKILRTSEI
ncbi:MAG: D-aminoacyl-tRNA deacylase [Nanoarchaeota archaeon]|nr:D-aminoacyl-tRNA deacylase [Nanoarchaeota archaeon]